MRVWCVNVRGRVGWGVRTGKGSRGKHARHINDARTQRPNIQHTRVNKRQSSCQRATVLPLMDLFQPTEERDPLPKRDYLLKCKNGVNREGGLLETKGD